MSKEEIQLMIQIIDNLEVYVTDETWVEMEEDMVGEGFTNFSGDMEFLKDKLEAM